MKPKIGIIGGMGPLATTIFLKKIIDCTNAKTDQENIPLTIIDDTIIPDRTAYILGKSEKSPVPFILNDIKSLEMLKCTHVAMICNTSHSFYEELKAKTKMEFVNMPELTLERVDNLGFKKPGLMATEGTLKTQVYQKFNKLNLDIISPNYDVQMTINNLIYEYVKKNKKVPKETFMKIIEYFTNLGCDSIILGCTELSVIIDDLKIKDENIIDSTTVLAEHIIKIYNQ